MTGQRAGSRRPGCRRQGCQGPGCPHEPSRSSSYHREIQNGDSPFEKGGGQRALLIPPVKNRRCPSVLDDYVQRITDMMDTPPFLVVDEVTYFHSRDPPDISVREYVYRIYEHADISMEVMGASMVYMGRLLQSSHIPCNRLTVHRLIISAIILAVKFIEDAVIRNAFFVYIGGLSILELNRMEVEFLKKIDYRLWIDFPERG